MENERDKLVPQVRTSGDLVKTTGCGYRPEYDP